jgi:type IV pilus assembly protein PilV
MTKPLPKRGDVMRQSGVMRQRGVMLIEALVGILIFAIGILALIAMQATAVRATQDARYRTEAVNFANDLLGQILVNVNRQTPLTLQASLADFEHQVTTNGNCDYSGAVATNPLVDTWAKTVTGTAAPPLVRLPLPGTSANMLQVLVDTSAGAHNAVTITVCWKAPDDPVARKHVLVSYVT